MTPTRPQAAPRTAYDIITEAWRQDFNSIEAFIATLHKNGLEIAPIAPPPPAPSGLREALEAMVEDHDAREHYTEPGKRMREWPCTDPTAEQARAALAAAAPPPLDEEHGGFYCLYQHPLWATPCNQPPHAPIHTMLLGWGYSGRMRHAFGKAPRRQDGSAMPAYAAAGEAQDGAEGKA